jgi:primosomal protein N' (replication factor Y) (superfamily II helicase)
MSIASPTPRTSLAVVNAPTRLSAREKHPAEVDDRVNLMERDAGAEAPVGVDEREVELVLLPEVVADRVVRVLPDETGINKVFDYLVPAGMVGAALIDVGAMVRISLQGRRVGGWVVGVDVEPATDAAKLKPIAKISSIGPGEAIISLARWGSWRWWGKPVHFLRTASPANNVRVLPKMKPLDAALLPVSLSTDHGALLAKEALAAAPSGAELRPVLLQLPPASDLFGVVLEAARYAGERGVLVLAPSISMSIALARRLRRAGAPVALYPNDWALAKAGGCIVIGPRMTAWAPIEPGVIVVLDEHDEVYKEERIPAWHARDVAIERARRGAIPCLLTSPIPSLEASESATLTTVSRAVERDGWPAVEVIDRSAEDPAKQRLISDRLVSLLRSDLRVVCILNRTGRAKLLVCGSCSEVARCERCDGALIQEASDEGLVCPSCRAARPMLCAGCGSAKLRNVRMGITRAREELEALALRPVADVSAPTVAIPDGVRLFVGTEALLHRIGTCDAVIFLDFDTELFAPRYRASDESLALIVRAARTLGGRGREDGATRARLVLQTRTPDHVVVQSAVRADPSLVREALREQREALALPPFRVIALIEGAGAPLVAAQLRDLPDAPIVDGPPVGPFLVRGRNHPHLCAKLSKVERPTERVRVEIDPLRM